MRVANCRKVEAKATGKRFHLSTKPTFCPLSFTNILPAVWPTTSVGFLVSVNDVGGLKKKNRSIVYIDLILVRTWSNTAFFSGRTP